MKDLEVGEMILESSHWSHGHHKVPKEAQRRERLGDARRLALKRKEGTLSQGVQASLEAGKSKTKDRISPRAFGGSTALPAPSSQTSDTGARRPPPELWGTELRGFRPLSSVLLLSRVRLFVTP